MHIVELFNTLSPPYTMQLCCMHYKGCMQQCCIVYGCILHATNVAWNKVASCMSSIACNNIVCNLLHGNRTYSIFMQHSASKLY